MYIIKKNPSTWDVDDLQNQINEIRLNQGIPDTFNPGQYVRQTGSWVLYNPQIQTMNDFTLTGPLANNDIIQYSTALSKFTNKPITQLDTVYI